MPLKYSRRANSETPLATESFVKKTVAAPQGNPGKSLAALWLVVVLLAGAMIYVGTINRSLRGADAAMSEPEKYNAEIINKIERLIILPLGEQPALAHLTDVTKLRQQNPDFYVDAINGDVLLVYTKKAFIYRESEDRLINVAPVIAHDKNDEKSLKTE
jgi:hypothetical protein